MEKFAQTILADAVADAGRKLYDYGVDWAYGKLGGQRRIGVASGGVPPPPPPPSRRAAAPVPFRRARLLLRRRARRRPVGRRGTRVARPVPGSVPVRSRAMPMVHREVGKAVIGNYDTVAQYAMVNNYFWVNPYYFGPRIQMFGQLYEKWKIRDLWFEFILLADFTDPFALTAAVEVDPLDKPPTLNADGAASMATWRHSLTMVSNESGPHILRYVPPQPPQGYFTFFSSGAASTDVRQAHAGHLYLMQTQAPAAPAHVTVIVHYDLVFFEPQLSARRSTSVTDTLDFCPPNANPYSAFSAAHRDAVLGGIDGLRWVVNAGVYSVRFPTGTFYVYQLIKPNVAPAGKFGFTTGTVSSDNGGATVTLVIDANATAATTLSTRIVKIVVPPGDTAYWTPAFEGYDAAVTAPWWWSVVLPDPSHSDL